MYTVKLLAMVDFPPWLQGLDINPREPLSNEDLIKVFTRYCDHQIRENNCLERDLTNEKFKFVIAELRYVRTCTDTHVLITKLTLKINTFSMYFEKLIHNLQAGLYDAFTRMDLICDKPWPNCSHLNAVETLLLPRLIIIISLLQTEFFQPLQKLLFHQVKRYLMFLLQRVSQEVTISLAPTHLKRKTD